MTIEHPSSFAQSAPDRAVVVVANTGATLTYGPLEDRRLLPLELSETAQ